MNNAKMKNCRGRRGVALLLALIILAVLATMGYAIVSKLVSIKHRHNYILNYYKAKYACDSVTRYGIDEVKNVRFEIQSREGMPDFSDLFVMTEEQYQYLLYEWTVELDEMRYEEFLKYQENLNAGLSGSDAKDDPETQFRLELLDSLGIGPQNYFGINLEGEFEPIDPNTLYVPGPYGPQWPYITEPMEIELEDVKVTVTVEDENAKLPLVWALMQDKELSKEKEACFTTFFEWMGVDEYTRELLWKQFEDTAGIKNFEIGMKPATIEKKEAVRTRTVTRDASGQRKSVFKTRYRTRKVPRSATGNNTDFSRLIDAEIDTERLAQSFYDFGYKDQNALKYLGVWGSDKVNVNTAPRNVLESTFVFGGQEVDLADAVIIERRIEPFKDIEDMKRRLFRFSNNIDKLTDLIVFESNVFSVKVEAVSGAAKATSMTAILYEDKKFMKITTIYN
jgi:type II secretory pathway component PulK